MSQRPVAHGGCSTMSCTGGRPLGSAAQGAIQDRPVEPGRADRGGLRQRRCLLSKIQDLVEEAFIQFEVRRHGPSRQAHLPTRTDAQPPSFATGRQHHAPLLSADHHRTPPQTGVRRLFDGGEEAVAIPMHDRPHSINSYTMLLPRFPAPRKRHVAGERCFARAISVGKRIGGAPRPRN